MAQEADMEPFVDAAAEIIEILLWCIITVLDECLWAIWDSIVKLFSTDHLGVAPAIIFFVIGFLFCIYFFVHKFWEW